MQESFWSLDANPPPPNLNLSENTRCFYKKPKSPIPVKIMLTVSIDHGQYDKRFNSPLKCSETIVTALMLVTKPHYYKPYQQHSLLLLMLDRTWTVVVVLHHTPAGLLKSVWVVIRGEERFTKANNKLTLERPLEFVLTDKKNTRKRLWM